MRSVISPAQTRESQYGINPNLVKKRGADIENMTSLSLKDLIPDLPDVIYPNEENDINVIRRATEKALESVDMNMIKPHHSVNILASHHGFTLAGGKPYAEMLKTIKDVVERKTGCKNIRLRAGVGLRFRETEEYIKRFELDKHFNRKAMGIAPIDEGIPIETAIGTLYGLRRAYDADWIIHVHNSDVREVHFHRQVDRAVKPFGMSYARIETRSTYHQNMGPRASNFIARAIFDSEFVKNKYSFSCFLMVVPNGIMKVDADNNLYSLNERVTITGCRYYGKMMTLLGTIDECIAVLDFPCPVPYVFSGGVIYANFTGANIDLYDLDNPLPPYTWYTEAFYGKRSRPLIDEIVPINPAIKTCIHNYAWTGYPSSFFAEHIPTIVVGNEQAELFNRDPQNYTYMQHSVIAKDTDAAIEFALKVAKTDKIIVFDGAVGGMNVSKSLADFLTEKAPLVNKRVEKELLPKWFAQRGLDLGKVLLGEKKDVINY